VGSQTAVSISVYHLMHKNHLNNGLLYISTPASNTKTGGLMLFLEIIPVYSENYMKSLNTFCGQNILMLLQMVYIVTTVI
jgi:hypothetical protein